jgi:hypothetical protein
MRLLKEVATYSKNEHPKHPPNKKESYDGSNNVANPLARGFWPTKAKHAAMVARVSTRPAHAIGIIMTLTNKIDSSATVVPRRIWRRIKVPDVIPVKRVYHDPAGETYANGYKPRKGYRRSPRLSL